MSYLTQHKARVANEGGSHAKLTSSNARAAGLETVRQPLIFGAAALKNIETRLTNVRGLLDRAHSKLPSLVSAGPNSDASVPDVDLQPDSSSFDSVALLRHIRFSPSLPSLESISVDNETLGLMHCILRTHEQMDLVEDALFGDQETGTTEAMAKDLLRSIGCTR